MTERNIQHTGSSTGFQAAVRYKGCGFDSTKFHLSCHYTYFWEISSFFGQNMILGLPVKNEENSIWEGEHTIRCTQDVSWGPLGSGCNMRTTVLYCWWSSHVHSSWTWVIYYKNVLSIKTILFDILDFWCQLEVIRFVKTLSKRRMFVPFMKISACWLLHRLIKFNKICWEKRPANPRPNLRTSFCRGDLKNNQPHLKSAPFMVPDLQSPRHLTHPLRNDPA